MKIEKILVTNNAKRNFLKGLIRVAKSDGVVDEEEFSFFQQAAITLGLSAEEIEELERCWKTNEKIEVVFDTSKEKMFFFVQAVQLCWIDNAYTEAEKLEIRSIAKELKTSLVAIESVEKWAYEGIIWNKKGDELLELV